MTLRKQTLIFFGISIICLLAVLMVVTSTIFLQGFNRVEEDTTRNNLQLATDILFGDISSLAQLQQDWADWDDAYNFVFNQSADFIQANLNDSTLARLRLRALVFLNNNNEIVYGTGNDPQSGKAMELPGVFTTYLTNNSPLFTNPSANSSLVSGSGSTAAQNGQTSRVSGIMLVSESESPLLVVSSPILTSDGTGPSRGTLIMMRSLDETEIRNLETRLHFPLKLERFYSPNLPADFLKARASFNLSTSLPTFSQPLDENTNLGYVVLKDISGKPVLILRIELSRQIYKQGQSSLYLLVALIIVVLVLFTALTIFLMDKMLLRRISDLKTEVNGIALSGNLATRVKVKGKDEIATLAQVTNQMLAALEQSRLNELTSENSFRLLIEKLSVGVTLHNARAEVQLANQAAANLLGVPLEVLVGKSYHNSDWRCIHEDGTEFPEAARPVWQAIITRTPVRNVTMGLYRPKEAEWIWLLVNTEPIVDDSGNLSSIICSFNDITERKKVEELKNEFISVVSHELRTPLTSIMGSLGLIIGGATGMIPTPARNMLDIAYKNSERLVRLINDILDIQKIESGKMTLHKRPLDMASLVEQAIATTRSFAESYGVCFEFNNRCQSFCHSDKEMHKELGAESSSLVMADSDRLTQVIVNLLSNAAKFSPSGETVMITLECVSDRTVRLAVTDRGPGISEEFQNRIFQKFAQADSSTTRQKGGTGLGLNISKSIMEKLNGNFSFTTVPGSGTTFYIELPLLISEEIELTK